LGPPAVGAVAASPAGPGASTTRASPDRRPHGPPSYR